MKQAIRRSGAKLNGGYGGGGVIHPASVDFAGQRGSLQGKM